MRAVILFFMLSAACLAGDQIVERQSFPDGLVVLSIDLPESKRRDVAWDVVSNTALELANGAIITVPMDMDYRTFETIHKTEEGEVRRSTCVFNADPGQDITAEASLIDFDVGFKYEKKWLIDIEGDPAPTPTPTPVPPGPKPDPVPPPDITNPLGKAIYIRAAKIEDPKNAARVADVFSGIASRLAAGGYEGQTVDNVIDDIVAGVSALKLPVSWASFGEFLTSEYKRQSNSIAMVRAITEVTAKSLNAVAGRSTSTFPSTSSNVTPSSNCRWVNVNGRLIQVCNP